MDSHLNGDKVDDLSFIVHKESANEGGKLVIDTHKHIIPRQKVEEPIQAAIGQKVVARTYLTAFRSIVMAKF